MARTERPLPQPLGDKWRIRWIDEHGRRRSGVYDNYDDALFKLDEHLLEVRQVERGLRGLSLPDKAFDQLCDHWLAGRAKRKRSEKDDQSIIKTRLRPFFGRHLLRNISLDLTDEFINEWAEVNSEKTVNNYLTLLIAMLNEAKDRGWLRDLPKIKKFKVELFDKDYSWLRNSEEIARLLGAARDEGEAVFVLFATAIYTGMRAGELAGLHWGSVDFARRLITVQSSYDGLTKSGRVRHVPIFDPLLPVLKAWRLVTPGRLVFPNGVGEMRQPSDRIFQEALHRVLDEADFPKREVGGRTRRYIRFHDLRHTFASHWVLGGGDIFKLQKLLGHASITMTQRYAHLAPEAFAGDLGRLGATVPGQGAVMSLPEPATRSGVLKNAHSESAGDQATRAMRT